MCIILTIIIHGSSYAFQSCANYDFSVDGMGLHKNCKESGLNTVSGDALPSLSSAFNINPAAIPVRKTPLGIEMIASSSTTSYSGWQHNFAVIRGFQSFGTAFSTNSDNTFYSNSLRTTATAATYGIPTSIMSAYTIPTLNFGVALPLLEKKLKAILPTLGISTKYNKDKQTFGYASGLSINSSRLSLGVSYSHEPAISSLPSEYGVTFTATLNADLLLIDYSDYYAHSVDSTGVSDNYRAKIFTFSFNYKKFGFSYAYKSEALTYLTSFKAMLAAIYQINAAARIAYMLNYQAAAQSIGLQLLLL